jgi:hypothetical protein
MADRACCQFKAAAIYHSTGFRHDYPFCICITMYKIDELSFVSSLPSTHPQAKSIMYFCFTIQPSLNSQKAIRINIHICFLCMLCYIYSS